MTEQGTSSRACHLRAWLDAWGLARAGADMTANRRSKRAVRSRMAQTGEKYTQAQRALAAAGGPGGGAGDDPRVTIRWPEGSPGWVTSQGDNTILPAAGQARVLLHPRARPRH